MGIFNWETFFGKHKQQQGEEQEEALCLTTTEEEEEQEEEERLKKNQRVTQGKEEGSTTTKEEDEDGPKRKQRATREKEEGFNPSDRGQKKKHVTPPTSTKEEEEEEEEEEDDDERPKKKQRVTQEKEEGLNSSDRGLEKKKHVTPEKEKRVWGRGSEKEMEMKRIPPPTDFPVVGGTTHSVVYDCDDPLKSTCVDPNLVGLCNKALENYNNMHKSCYEYLRLLKAETTIVSYICDYEIIFDASLSDEDGHHVETLGASIKTGLGVQKGVRGYGMVVNRVGKYKGPPFRGREIFSRTIFDYHR